MPVPASSLRTFGYVVTYLMPTYPEPSTDTTRFEAAYFVEEGSLVSFKDAGHAVVRAFKSELLVDIERMDETVAAAR